MAFQFDSVRDFLIMSGHGAFVWGAYGVSLLVLIYLVAGPLLRARARLREIRQQNAAQNRRRKTAGPDAASDAPAANR